MFKFAMRHYSSSMCFRFKRWHSENWVFLHRITFNLFLKNEAQINKTNYATTLFISKQVSLPNIALDPAKIKIDPKCYICPFCTKAFNIICWKQVFMTKTQCVLFHEDYFKMLMHLWSILPCLHLGAQSFLVKFPEVGNETIKVKCPTYIGGLQPFPRDSNNKDLGGHVGWQEQ